MTPDEVRRWVRWLGWFMSNMCHAEQFSPTDAEADQMVEAFQVAPDDMGKAWQAAADIWEGRERVA